MLARVNPPRLQVDDLLLTVRRSARRKTVQITVERDGELVLCVPPEADESSLRTFVLEKRFWIYSRLAERDRLQRQVPRKEFVGGEGFLYLGRSHRLKLVDGQDAPLKLAGGRWVMNLALFTYFIPAAFLAVPMYKTMGNYGLLNNQWALILAMVTIASPYCIWVLKQASDKLPWELDEAARMDGATPLQLFRLVYLPLMVPSLVAVGTYSLLLAWNEYLYAFLLLSKDTDVTLSVALGSFMSADDSPWELLMATGLIYALPPAAIYYAFKRYMVGGLTAGAVKS